MIIKKEISDLIDYSDSRYLICWEILNSFINFDPSKPFFQKLLDFQSILCDSLFRLERAYHLIHQEKQRIIERKRKLSPNWFRARLKALSHYQSAITQTFSIGRCLGDSYAWLFYHREQQLLSEHQKHRPIDHMPIGIGGIGELEFIKRFKGIGNNLLIYHGTTTILRIGDISLIDLKTLTVSAIGELKTRKAGDRQLEINFTMVGPRLEDNFKSVKLNENAKLTEFKLSNREKERFKRQIKSIHASFQSKLKYKTLDKIKLYSSTSLEKLDELGRNLENNAFVYQKAGKGLLLMAYKSIRKKLSSRILKGIATQNKLGQLSEKTMQIMDVKSRDNRIIISPFVYSQKGKYNIPDGITPFFWWPLDMKLIKKIIFRQVLVLTIYNPLHFIKKIEEIGLTVSYDRNTRRYLVGKVLKGKMLEVRGFSYFIMLIQNYLFSEDAVLKIIGKTISKAKTLSDTARNIILNMHIQQQFESEEVLLKDSK